MARPIKIGLDYFNIDTNIFSSRKIRRLLNAHGCVGYTVYSFILSEIYQYKGYYVTCDEDFIFDIQDRFNSTSKTITEIINFCLDFGLFNKQIFEKYNILTSQNIQIRYRTIIASSKRILKIDENYNLLINSEETKINSEETKINTEETKINSEFSTQRKRKEIKEKEIKDFSISYLQKNRFLEIFLFKNFLEPEQEVERFIDHYQKTNWHNKNGIKITDIFAAARTWDQTNPPPGYRLPFELTPKWHQAWTKFDKSVGNFDNSSIFLKLRPLRFENQVLTIKITAKEIAEKLETDYFDAYKDALYSVFKFKTLQYV